MPPPLLERVSDVFAGLGAKTATAADTVITDLHDDALPPFAVHVFLYLDLDEPAGRQFTEHLNINGH